MPCYLVITIQLKDLDLAKQACSELGLEEGTHFDLIGTGITLRAPAYSGLVKQRYGVLEAERQARKRGVKTQRKTLQDGTIQLLVG